MAIDFYKNIERVLSKDRFDSYRKNCGSDHEALTIYVWNTTLCEALYPSFQILEVGFRNAVHCEIAKALKDSTWLSNKPRFLFEDELAAIDLSKESLQKRGGNSSEPKLVAEMSFGFWTSILDSRYETMWHKIIVDVFPNMPRTIRTRGEVSKRMNAVRKLRNAAFHHHSIWHWHDLEKQHAETHVLIGWICSSISAMAKSIDRFPAVYSGGSQGIAHIVKKMSN